MKLVSQMCAVNSRNESTCQGIPPARMFRQKKEKNLYVTRPGENPQASGQGEGKPALFFGSSHIRPQHKHLDNTWFFRH